MADDFVQQIARLLGRSPEETERTLHALADSIRDEVAASGEAQIEGLGVFRRAGDDLTFEPAPSLARAVNHRYAGLPTLESGEAKPPAEREPETPPEASAPETGDPFDAAAAPPLDLPPEPTPAPVRDLSSEPDIEEFDEPVEAELPSEAELPTEAAPIADIEPVADLEAEAGPHPEIEDEPEQEDEPELQGEMIEEDALDDAADLDDEGDETFEDEIDALLEGVWMPATGATDTDHPLGPTPPEMMEEADFSVMDEGKEPDTAPAAGATPEAEVPAEPVGPPEIADETEHEEQAMEPPPVSPPEPPPSEAPTPAPGFAATAASAAAETPPERGTRAPRERRTPILGVIAALVVGTLALVWFLNREPVVPPTAEQPAPTAADTAEAVPPPAPSDAAGDTAAVAEAVPDEPEPEPSDDPLRSTAGLDPAQGGFAWVVASELSREPAETRVEEFRAQGFRAGVIAEEAAGRTRYRVALGQFDSADEANQFRDTLPAGVPTDTWLLRF